MDTLLQKQRKLFSILKNETPIFAAFGGLAQLARAFAWHAKGHRFDPGNLHHQKVVS